MGIFSFPKKNIHEQNIKKLESKILNSVAFKSLSIDDTVVAMQFKKFEVIMIASAIYYAKLKENHQNEDFNDVYDQVKRIYFREASPFLREYILSGILSFDIFIKKNIIETDIILEVHVKFSKYVQDISYAIKEHKPYFTEDWPGEYEGEVIERKIYYEFISNLFFSFVELNSDNKQYIATKDDWIIEDFEADLLNTFASECL